MGRGVEAGGCCAGRRRGCKNQGLRNTRETSLAKWFCTDHAVQAALDAIQVHGAYGYSTEYPVERYLRNAKARSSTRAPASCTRSSRPTTCSATARIGRCAARSFRRRGIGRGVNAAGMRLGRGTNRRG